jgi:intergrase/recombinase
LTPNGAQFVVKSFVEWIKNKNFVKDYEVGLINKIPLIFQKEQKHTYKSLELFNLIKNNIDKINEDKYLNRLVRQILNYSSEKEIISENDISVIKKKLKTKKSNVDNYVPTDNEVLQTLSQLSDKVKLVYLMYLVSGIRKVEGRYLLDNVSSLKSQQFDGFVKVTMNYLRKTKNSYFCYLPLEVYSKLSVDHKQISVSHLERELKTKHLIPIKYCRKWFYTKCIELGVPDSIADYYQGRVSNSVGGNHYLSRQLLADQNYKKILNLFVNF